MPLAWRKKTLLAKIESVYGTDSVPTAAADAILAKNIKLSPMEGSDVSRELELPYMGNQGTIANELHAKLEFETELAGSGTAGTAPAWGKLLRMCGWAETIVAVTSVTYNRVTDNHSSGSIYFFIGNTRYVLRGTRGDGTVTINSQGIPVIKWVFTGLFSIPTEVAPAAATLGAWKKPKIASMANTPVFTVNAVSLVLRDYSYSMGNKVEGRFLIGSEGILITDMNDMIKVQVEAVPLSTFDPYTLAEASTAVPVIITHGTVAGNIISLNAPLAQMQRPEGLEAVQDIAEWPLSFVATPNTGNDQISIVCT